MNYIFVSQFEQLVFFQAQLTAFWKGRATEVVVSVVPSQIIGSSFLIRHSELQTLKPHQWLTGEVCIYNNKKKICHLKKI